ncbi:MAG: hypothetical protein IPM46_14030 [Flavobacteriales bacterium]|nr:hypothetical protein [Flavobacteriales bacterium]
MNSRLHLPLNRTAGYLLLGSLLVCGLFSATVAHGQSVGPNSPATAVNDAGIGSNAWTNPGNALSSDNARATLSTKGVTNYLQASQFGFGISSPAGISGIQVDVERSASAVNNVALLDAWATGLTRTVSAGINRCLVVTYAQENGNGSRDITAMTYGGRAMTQMVEIASGTPGGFHARLEVWVLLDADIALASGTTIVPTYGAYTPQEYCEAFSAAVFQHVDQLNPVSSQQASGAVATTNPHQLGSAIGTQDGSMALNIATSGNNTTPGITNGGTDTYTINSGYTEGTDLYFANTVDAPTSGACIQTAHKAITTGGTEQPSCTFNGSVNRWAMIGLTLQRARELDHAVRLVKGGVIAGNNLASASAWPTSDAYATYGGATELWGQAWNLADVNASNFGAALAARVQNGTARVDHMRITVFYYSTLPVELLYFRAWQEGQRVRLDWATASELGNDRFEVLRGTDGQSFSQVLSVPGTGNSNTLIEYSAIDHHPLPGTNYYRLKQVDTDGTSSSSSIVAVTFDTMMLVPYPNPTEGMLHLSGMAPEGQEVTVLNHAMQVVMKAPLTAEDPIVNLEGLPDGTYTILVFDGQDWTAARAVKQSSMR